MVIPFSFLCGCYVSCVLCCLSLAFLVVPFGFLCGCYVSCVLCCLSGILGDLFQFSVWLLCVLCPMTRHITTTHQTERDHQECQRSNIGHKTHSWWSLSVFCMVAVFVFAMCLVSYVACLWHSWWSLSVFCVVVMCLVSYVACLCRKGSPRLPETSNIGHKTHNNHTENWKGSPRMPETSLSVFCVVVMCLVSYVACLWHSWWSLSVFCVVVMCLASYVACLNARQAT
jgi:hypothetical protein